MQRLIIVSALLILPSFARAQAPTVEQFTAYRQALARDIGNAEDAKAICEAGAATLATQNQQLQKQVAQLKSALAKATGTPRPEHNPPSP